MVCLRQLLFTNLITVEILEFSLVKMKWHNGSAMLSFPVFVFGFNSDTAILTFTFCFLSSPLSVRCSCLIFFLLLGI